MSADSTGGNRALRAIALLLPALTVAVLVTFAVQDPDTFWHISNGRAMVAEGRIVSEELFSYTMPGTKFYNHEWLSQIILYLTYSAGGGGGLALLKTLIAVTIFALQYRALRALGADGVSASLLAVAGIWAGLERYKDRPEVFSLLFLALLVWLLNSIRSGALGQRALFFIPLIMAVWECFHGGIYGLAYLGVFAGAETIWQWLGRRRGVAAEAITISLKQLWVVAAITMAVLIVSPYGLRHYGTFFSLAGKGLMVGMNEEFQRTPFMEYRVYWAMLILAWALIIVYYKEVKIDIVHVALLLFFSLLSARYLRAIAAFAIVAVPVIGRYLAYLQGTEEWGLLWRRSKYVLWAMLLAWVIYLKFLIPGSPFAFDWRVDEQRLPVGEARFVKETGLTGNMYNPGNFGGVLAYELYPERRIFMYNHHMVFENLLMETFDKRFLDKYNIAYAVMRKDSWIEKSLFPSDLWAIAYWNDAGVVAVKNTPEHAAYLAKYGLRYYLPEAGDEALALMLRDQPSRLPAIAEAARVSGYARNPRTAAFVGASIMKYRTEIPRELALSMLRQAFKHNRDSPELKEALRTLGWGV